MVAQADEEFGLERRNGLELLREFEIGAGSAVGLDDALGEQVADGISGLGDVGREEMVKGAIFADQYDDVFDGSFRGGVLLPILSLQWHGNRAAKADLDNGEQSQAGAQMMQRLPHTSFERH